jgi:hypothetical protein
MNRTSHSFDPGSTSIRNPAVGIPPFLDSVDSTRERERTLRALSIPGPCADHHVRHPLVESSDYGHPELLNR